MPRKPRPIIAIVDDDPELPIALSSLIRSLGYDAECFTSAAELLDWCNLSEVSCIISDIHMPHVTGVELARSLGERAPGLPVILMTGRNDAELAERAQASGAIALITKPFSVNQLSSALLQALTPADPVSNLD